MRKILSEENHAQEIEFINMAYWIREGIHIKIKRKLGI